MTSQADGFSDDEGDVDEYADQEPDHPAWCMCDLCRGWLFGPEAYLIRRDGLPPE